MTSKSASYLDSLGEDADVPDKASGLTPREVAHIQYIWDIVKPNMKIHGTQFFLAFFEQNPQSQEKFKPFRGKPLSELKDSKRLAAHGTTVMSAIGSYIDNLDDPECVVEMLETTAENHKRRDVTKSDFKNIPSVLVGYLKKQLSDVWTPEIEGAWIKLMDLVVAIINAKL